MKAYILLILGISLVIAGVFIRKYRNNRLFLTVSGTVLIVANLLLNIFHIKPGILLMLLLGAYLLPVTGIVTYKKLNGVALLFFIVVASLPLVYVFYQARMPVVSFSEQSIHISGQFGGDIKLTEIKTVDTVSIYPKLTVKHGGSTFLKIINGSFDMENESRGRLHIYSEPPYIQIRLNNNELVFINFREKDKTIEFYTELTRELRIKN
jgi:hypothetical protein